MNLWTHYLLYHHFLHRKRVCQIYSTLLPPKGLDLMSLMISLNLQTGHYNFT